MPKLTVSWDENGPSLQTAEVENPVLDRRWSAPIGQLTDDESDGRAAPPPTPGRTRAATAAGAAAMSAATTVRAGDTAKATSVPAASVVPSRRNTMTAAARLSASGSATASTRKSGRAEADAEPIRRTATATDLTHKPAAQFRITLCMEHSI